MAQDGYASAADIDTAMMLGCGYPRGPFDLIDATGAADVLAGLRAMFGAHPDPALAPPPMLTEHVAAGVDFAVAARADVAR
jgi:3-hydroxybutyryl-CoA dehydrogenase